MRCSNLFFERALVLWYCFDGYLEPFAAVFSAAKVAGVVVLAVGVAAFNEFALRFFISQKFKSFR